MFSYREKTGVHGGRTSSSHARGRAQCLTRELLLTIPSGRGLIGFPLETALTAGHAPRDQPARRRQRQRGGRRFSDDAKRHVRCLPGADRGRSVRDHSSTTAVTASASSCWPCALGCTSFGSTSPASTESPPASLAFCWNAW